MIERFLLQQQYRQGLLVISEKSPTAATQKKSECCSSGVCCWRAPGELNPEDVKRLSSYFNITEQEFFKQYCIVDIYYDKTILRLRRKHQEGGVMTDWRETYSIASPCVFLEERESNDSKCGIHEVKPLQCTAYKCWEGASSLEIEGWSKEELMKLGWDGVNPDE